MEQTSGRVITDAQELQDIAARAAAAEAGPWRRRESWHGESWEVTSAAGAFPVCASPLADPKDADFIAAAREDVPNLLATVAYLRARECEATELLRALLELPALDEGRRGAITALLSQWEFRP